MKKSLVMILLVAIAAVSCKKTVESEQKSWENNQKRASQISYEYPNFAGLIKEQVEIARKIMDESAAITDEKARIEKMAYANSQVIVSFIRNLEEIKSLKSSIRSKATEARGLKSLYNEMMMINQAISDSERIIMDSENKLKSEVNTRQDADALTGLVVSDMRTAQSNLERVIALVKDREAAEKKKIEEKNEKTITATSNTTDSGKQVEVEATITCKYCGTVNPGTSTTCKGCGASLK